jgi:hypothetical protein
MIALAEFKGEGLDPRTLRLKAELADALADGLDDDEGDDDEDDDEDDIRSIKDLPIVAGLPFSRRINRLLQDYGVFEVEHLERWTGRLLGRILKWNDVLAVRSVLSAIGLGTLLGSALEVYADVPPKSPFALDVRDGRSVAECLEILEELAYGRETQRSGSILAGGNELAECRAHQRICSMLDRLTEFYAPMCARAIVEQFGDYIASASVNRIKASKRPWIVRTIIRKPVDEVAKVLKLADISDPVGHTFRGCRITLLYEADGLSGTLKQQSEIEHRLSEASRYRVSDGKRRAGREGR